MEGLLKNKVFLFSVVLNLTLLIFAIASCSETQRQQQRVDEEMYKRMDAEDRLENSAKERQGIEESIASLRQQLEDERASHELTKKALLHEQLVGKAIKEELNRVTKTSGQALERLQ
jgi:hypothetical protein